MVVTRHRAKGSGKVTQQRTLRDHLTSSAGTQSRRMSRLSLRNAKEDANAYAHRLKAGPVAPPLEMLPALLQAFKEWRNRWRPKIETFEFSPGESVAGLC